MLVISVMKRDEEMIRNSERVTLEKIKTPERFQYNQEFLEQIIKKVAKRVFDVMPDFVHDFPPASSENLWYSTKDNPDSWVEGFWTGMLWLSYEVTDNALYRAVAETQLDDYQKRLDEFRGLSHHDIGFLYTPSAVAQYRLTGAPRARALGLRAAELLAKRYSETAGIIQVRDTDVQGVFIADCCMNLPLLFWASQTTGDRSYYLKALRHITQVCSYMIRDDGSTFQRYKIDEVTGEPQFGSQGQGYNDESCWSRGQTWVIYGLALAYRYTREKEFLRMCKRVANYYLNRLPSDLICNWDLIFTGDGDPRDSSSAPVAACGLLELAGHLPEGDPDKEIYRAAAGRMLQNLSEGYLTPEGKSNGLLLHGVYVKFGRPGREARGCGDDECCIWGDYFFMEGLLRLKKPEWIPYW